MILNLLILFLGVPIGLLIAWLARDELKQGRKWFRIMIILSLLGGLWFWLIGRVYISLTWGFIFIIVLVALAKSQDKKWTKI
ncbi:hypothetical protein AUJ84_03595 [Candidatus Pacearchaeota archaeon CG1_02_32_132]|nr:MAG: hypothetical protein AUJ84_03595 [Candidatus Pacearchaeota archaeon CG1_02_32_132]